MEHYDIKVFTGVLCWFTTKFAPLKRVYWSATCKQGQYTRKRLDTPESWHAVCLFLVGVSHMSLMIIDEGFQNTF